MPPVLGPVFSVELFTSGRRARYFVIRVFYALVLLIALWVNYRTSFDVYGGTTSVTIQQMASFAASFFITFAWMQLVAVLLLTPAMVAGTVAQEHERRTIEYLLVSPLRNSEIVLDKLAARVLAVGMQLLAGLPVLAIAMLLGGIGPEALLRVFLLTFITLLSVASISLAVSTWTRRTRDAITRAYLMLLAWLLVPPLGYAIAMSMIDWNAAQPLASAIVSVGTTILQLNPVYALGVTTWGSDWGMDGWKVLAWFAGGNLLLTLLCLAASVMGVRRTAIAGLGVSSRRPRIWWRKWRPPTWRPKLGAHPMLWKELFAERSAVTLGWPGRIAVALLLFGLLFFTLYAFIVSWQYDASVGGYLEFVATFGTLVACLGMLFMTARAAGAITSEKERDCWVTLISTPLTGREIILGKICGALYASRWWFALLLFMYTLGVVRVPAYAMIVPLQLGTVALLATFGISLGTFCSLVSKTSLRAMGAALAISLVLGGGYMLCGSVLFIGSAGSEELALVLAPSIAFLVGFAHWGGIAWLDDGFSLADFDWVGVAYLLGMFIYAVATGMLIILSIETFDARAGRQMEKLRAARAADRMSPSPSGRGPG